MPSTPTVRRTAAMRGTAECGAVVMHATAARRPPTPDVAASARPAPGPAGSRPPRSTPNPRWEALSFRGGGAARSIQRTCAACAAGGTPCAACAHTDEDEKPTIQAKLTVGPPDDRFEREADRVADHVMRMPVPRGPGEVAPTPAAQPTPVASPAVQSYVEGLPGKGQPLPDAARDYFEPRFGYGFDDVRIHTDADAQRSAGALRARAFTLGPNVVFGSGEYHPHSPQGLRLLAHELTHVVQQGAAHPAVRRFPAVPGGPLAHAQLFPERRTSYPRLPEERAFGLPVPGGEAGRALDGGGASGGASPLWHLVATSRAGPAHRVQRQETEGGTAPDPCPDRASQPVASSLMAAGRAGSARTFGARLTAAEDATWAALPEPCRSDHRRCAPDSEEERLSRLHGRIHAAMDADAPTGTAVYAPIRGEVIPAGAAEGYGNRVFLRHDCPPATAVAGVRPLTTFYAHLDTVLVAVGQSVRAGDPIGTVGSTGRGSGHVRSGMGAHLHFSVHRVRRAGPTDTVTSRYEESSLRIRPDVWLREIGVAVARAAGAP